MGRKKTHWCAEHRNGCPYSFPIEEGKYCDKHRCHVNPTCRLKDGHSSDCSREEGKSDEVWGHSRSDSPDRWEGAEPTRAHAINEGRSQYGIDATFYIIRGARCSASDFVPDAQDVLETMCSRAGDDVGEAAEDFPSVSDEAKKELEDFLEAWANKHAECTFWLADGEVEEIPPLKDMSSELAASGTERLGE